MHQGRRWNILCWNVRGINAENKHLAIRNAIDVSGCDVLCLQETKRTMFDRAFVKLICPKRLDKFAFVPSDGASGGLFTAWNSSSFSGSVILEESFALGIKFTSTHSNAEWTLVNVYGPCDGIDRMNFTAWLFSINIPITEDWILAGDFNYIRAPDNRNRPGGNSADMLTFNDFIRTQSLVEIPIKGRSYTWSNMQDNPLLEQLDWFLSSVHWTSSYPNTVVLPLGKPVSDHVPCVISIESTIPKSNIFRFENFWIHHSGFHATVQNSWLKPCHAPNSAAVLCKKLKNLRYDLKSWSKKISRLSMLIENSNKTLLDLDVLEERRRLTVPETNFRNILKAHLLKLLDYKRIYWQKRCTVRWFQVGDGNTQFFHTVATERYRRNSIATIKLEDGTVVEDHVGKEAALFLAYKQRLGCSDPPNMLFDLEAIIKKVEGLEELTVPFTTDEIDQAVKEMPTDRAPGPDGFNGCFLKSCWHIVKHDFYKLIMDFYEGDLDLESLNTGFITLIPKCQSPETVNDYRPITLLNCCLKLLTKLLANRLQRVILRIVHKNQYGFLRSRSIQDCIAWAFEYIHQCQSSGRKVLLLKLDFAKAFDTIEHKPMIEIMRAMGFGDRWLKWISSIFSSGKSSVLLNGTPGRQFKCKRGVRQGDPLSPLIFVLAADLLQAAINNAFRAGILRKPIPSSEQDYPVVQYADDTIVFLPAEKEQAECMKRLLVDYAASIGLRLNFQKSTLIPINLQADEAQVFADIFGCAVGQMPFTYLGLPLGTTKPTVNDLMPLVASVERKISVAANLLDYGSKLTFVNSVLSSLVVYAMCSIRIPPKIVEHLDKLRRHCFWNKQTEDGPKHNSLAAWDLICRPKLKGGLGIVNLKIQNQGLLLKQLYKFYNQLDVPWVKLVWTSYYPHGVPHAADPCGSFWWRDLIQLSDIFRGVTQVKIGDGSTTLFWKDLWNEQPLTESHPRAFSFARNEDITVQKLLTSTTIGEAFHLPMSLQAREEINSLQQLTMGLDPGNNQKDRWLCVWGNKESEMFKSSEYYKFCFRDVHVDEVFAWIWKSKCTNKWRVFAWLLLADRLNTRNMLRRRQYKLDGDVYTCLLCASPPEETVVHLFFTCPFSAQCWNQIGMSWPDSSCRFDLMHGGKIAWNRPLFMETFVIAAWGIWKERNNKHFRGVMPSLNSWRERFRNDMSMMVHRTKDSLHRFIEALVAAS
jgi:hypothetical protein